MGEEMLIWLKLQGVYTNLTISIASDYADYLSIKNWIIGLGPSCFKVSIHISYPVLLSARIDSGTVLFAWPSSLKESLQQRKTVGITKLLELTYFSRSKNNCALRKGSNTFITDAKSFQSSFGISRSSGRSPPPNIDPDSCFRYCILKHIVYLNHHQHVATSVRGFTASLPV